MFLGTYEYAMDERGRVPIPPRFRDALRDGLVLTQGAPDRCVRGYSLEGFETEAELLTTLPGMGHDGRIVRRHVFSRSYPAEVDRQGRVLIPAPLRRFAELEDQVVVAGTGERFEIWSADAFESVLASEQEEFERAVESVRRPPQSITVMTDYMRPQ